MFWHLAHKIARGAFLMVRKNGRFLLWAVLLCSAFAGLLRWPAEAAQAVRDSLSLCAGTILPALFPFFVLSTLVVGSGLAARLGRPLERCMKALFRVNGACAAALVLGLIGGYPVGARTTAELYRTGRCSASEARRLLGFCNNAGPSFLIGVVGVGIFQSTKLGLLLECIHIFSALLIGLLCRFVPDTQSAHEKAAEPLSPARSISAAALLPRAVQQSVSALLNVCGFIVLFGVLLKLLNCCGLLRMAAQMLSALLLPFGVSEQWCTPLLGGMLELCSGVAALPIGAASIPMAAFLLGWGGLSVHCQTMSVLEGSGLSIRPCLIGKLLHGALSAALTALALKLWPKAISASALLSSPLDLDALPRLALGVGLFGCGLIVLVFLGGKGEKQAGNWSRNKL